MLSSHPACIPINTAIQFKLQTKIHIYGFSASSKLKWNNWFVDFQVVQNLKRWLKSSIFTFFKLSSVYVLFQAPLIETQAFPRTARPRPHTGSHY